jgi:putative ABC transport system substrate-binding protein
MWAILFVPVPMLLLALAVLVGPPVAEAQEATKVRWIGVLRITPDLAWMEALRGGLRDLGYVEGQQIGIIDRLAEERSHRLPDLAAELVRLKVDVIVTAGPVSTRAAK